MYIEITLNYTEHEKNVLEKRGRTATKCEFMKASEMGFGIKAKVK